MMCAWRSETARLMTLGDTGAAAGGRRSAWMGAVSPPSSVIVTFAPVFAYIVSNGLTCERSRA